MCGGNIVARSSMEPKFTPCGSEVFVKEREVGLVCLVGLVSLASVRSSTCINKVKEYK
jgi:hypothetical protein